MKPGLLVILVLSIHRRYDSATVGIVVHAYSSPVNWAQQGQGHLRHQHQHQHRCLTSSSSLSRATASHGNNALLGVRIIKSSSSLSSSLSSSSSSSSSSLSHAIGIIISDGRVQQYHRCQFLGHTSSSSGGSSSSSSGLWSSLIRIRMNNDRMNTIAMTLADNEDSNLEAEEEDKNVGEGEGEGLVVVVVDEEYNVSNDGIEKNETSDSNSNATPPPPITVTATATATKPYYSLGVKSHRERQPDEHGQTPPTQPNKPFYSLGLRSYQKQRQQLHRSRETESLEDTDDDDDLEEECVTVTIGDSNTTNVTTKTSIDEAIDIDSNTIHTITIEDGGNSNGGGDELASNIVPGQNSSVFLQQDDSDWDDDLVSFLKTMITTGPTEPLVLNPKTKPKRSLLESFSDSDYMATFSSFTETQKNNNNIMKEKMMETMTTIQQQMEQLSNDQTTFANTTAIPTLNNSMMMPPTPLTKFQSSTTSSPSNMDNSTTTMKTTAPNPNNPTLNDNTNNDNNSNNAKPLTLSDLERVLNQSGYLRREDVESIAVANNYNSTLPNNPSSSSSSSSSRATRLSTSPTTGGSGGGGGTVAFPQPSILSNRDLQIGSSISSSFFCFLVFTSVRPNLWLLGTLMGGYYGYGLTERLEQQQQQRQQQERQRQVEMGVASSSSRDGVIFPPPIPLPPPPTGLYADMVLKSGNRIARTYLKLWDFTQQIWFMYRTGQLSYDYYKKYEKLDSKFQIQDKMDAWNARFVAGKQNFDKWEKENEVGRKVLAGLRTAWMVNENSYKTQQFKYTNKRPQSKYRLIQYTSAIASWSKKFLRALANTLTGSGNDGELREIILGVKVQLSEVLKLEVVSQRTGAAIAALIVVNTIGAMFAIAPSLLAFLAIVAGIVWPDFVSVGYREFRDLVDRTRARGRGEYKVGDATGGEEEGGGELKGRRLRQLMPRRSKKKRDNRVSTSSDSDSDRLVDRNNFHYYTKNDGTKRWYRTGKSKFVNDADFFNFLHIDFKKKKDDESKGQYFWRDWIGKSMFSNEPDKSDEWDFLDFFRTKNFRDKETARTRRRRR